MTELVAEEPDIACAEAEAFGDNAGGQAVDERCPEGLIAALPLRGGTEEIGGVSHVIYYTE
ncbi:MAG: hypothetical protein M0C28_16910 [Candidatus Moduliflexus flocculans]|nr:hypothetical protein [Candidatus Moduliflexus flocculans]